MASVSVHTATPDLSVLDGRGLVVRSVACLRSRLNEPVQLLTSSRRQDLVGRPVATRDPRFTAAPEEAIWNLTSVYSLSGLPVQVDSVDSGWRLHLYADGAQLVGRWDSRGSCWWTDLDEQKRPVALHEQKEGQSAAVVERFEYAQASPTAAHHNQCGRLIRHDDPGGTRRVEEYGLAGQPMIESRQFLQGMQAPDWPAEALARDALLEPETVSATHYLHGATGELIEQADAQGNRRFFHHDRAGYASDLFLQPAGAGRQCLVSERDYSASGALLTQRLGNGVLLQAEFDPRDGLLGRMSARRASGASLYDWHYDLDPVGNVLSIEDRSRAVRYFRNQRIEPIQTRQYDSMYRLAQASGFEVPNTGLGPDLPTLAPDPEDDSQLTNYTRHYQYDAADNVLEVRHVAQQGSFTRRMRVSPRSNHALPFQDEVPPDLESGFDANGNQLWLQAGQPLSWDARNRLVGYGAQRNTYDGNGLRVRKQQQWSARVVEHYHDVRYLPGLELHHKTAKGERLAVLTLQSEGFTCRLLHWDEGRPDGMANDFLSYGLSDHLGSGCLELDRDAELISSEVYYPFGGTAWWAARSAVEASYKTIRYSGHERDASGLYDYGARYYAPWLHRWISPDPAGAVDGPNLYTFVRNNPTTLIDGGGLQVRWSKLGGLGGVDVEVNTHHDDLNEPRQIKVLTSQLNWVQGNSNTFDSQLTPGKLNVPESLYSEKRQGTYSILSTKFTIPESCIQSTEYLIAYLAGDTRPFNYAAEAEGDAEGIDRNPNVEAVGWGKQAINITTTEALEAVFRNRTPPEIDETKLGVKLGQGLVFANSKVNNELDEDHGPFHFMTVTGVVVDDAKNTLGALMTDLVEPEIEEGSRLRAARNWAPVMVTNIEKARGAPGMGGELSPADYAAGIVRPVQPAGSPTVSPPVSPPLKRRRAGYSAAARTLHR